ncbi:MAG TPA: hypothetical protein VEX40_08595, partial [Mycobacterium sp.]|nr:hypothetical protein [Mycobacterium sp.]
MSQQHIPVRQDLTGEPEEFAAAIVVPLRRAAAPLPGDDPAPPLPRAVLRQRPKPQGGELVVEIPTPAFSHRGGMTVGIRDRAVTVHH